MGNHLEHFTQAISERLRDEHRAVQIYSFSLLYFYFFLIALPLIRWLSISNGLVPEASENPSVSICFEQSLAANLATLIHSAAIRRS